MQKWEYAILKLHGNGEFWLYMPDGGKPKIKGNQSLAEILGELGNAGWEAVNLQVIEENLGVMTPYSAWPSFLGVILFKRAKEQVSA